MKKTAKIIIGIGILCYLSTLPNWDQLVDTAKTAIESLAQTDLYKQSEEKVKDVISDGLDAAGDAAKEKISSGTSE